MSKSCKVSHVGIAVAMSLVAVAATGRAEAADYLRGAYAGETAPAAAGPDWAGYYAGVHAGISSAEVDARRFASPLAHEAIPNTVQETLLRDSINFKAVNDRRASFGIFAGYNVLWDDVVLGFEADYSRSKLAANSSSGPHGIYEDTSGVRNAITNAVADARGEIRDWGTIRGRVGYAMGYFMPYLTAGIAVGNVNSRATTSGGWYTQSLDTPPAFATLSGTFSGVLGRRGIAYGGAYGAGVDMQFFPNMFLRAEYQGVTFASGGKRPDISISTARVGGGIKF